MKKYLLFIGVLFSCYSSFAICALQEISIFPFNNIINKNGIILVTIPDYIGYNYNTLDSLNWIAINQFGVEYKLDKTLVHGGRNSQILLKSSINFKQNDTLRLKIKYNSPPQDIIYENSPNHLQRDNIIFPRLSLIQLEKLKLNLSNKQWVVNNIIDNIIPNWLDTVIHINLYDHTKSTSNSFGITFNTKAEDQISTINFNKDSTNYQIYEVKYKNQTSYLLGKNSFALYFGNCGSNIYYPLNTLCTFHIKLMDISGNYASTEITKNIYTETKNQVIRYIPNRKK